MGRAIAFSAYQDVFVGDEGALRVDGKRRAAEHLTGTELDQHQRHGILVLLADGAVIDACRPDEAAVAVLGGVELGTEARDRRVVARASRRVGLALDAGDLLVRLYQCVLQPLALILPPGAR